MTHGPAAIHLPRRSAPNDTATSFDAMAGQVRVRVLTYLDPSLLFDQVRDIFARVEAACTRFDPQSDLMRANRGGDEWCDVSEPCADALSAAFDAYRLTGGLFDPRVLNSLTALGYDRTLPFAGPPLTLDAPAIDPAPGRLAGRDAWSPRFDRPRGLVRLGPEPVDLGGIAKGLAVAWAAERLRAGASSFFVEAGGDCQLAGGGPSGTGWDVGVEDPSGGAEPVAVLRLRDAGCATSSIRLRRWTAGSVAAHHLIDPRSGAPARSGLVSVTVVTGDVAMSEVWSKALFVLGAEQIGARAAAEELAALWVHADGRVEHSAALAPRLLWQRAS